MTKLMNWDTTVAKTLWMEHRDHMYIRNSQTENVSRKIYLQWILSTVAHAISIGHWGSFEQMFVYSWNSMCRLTNYKNHFISVKPVLRAKQAHNQQPLSRHLKATAYINILFLVSVLLSNFHYNGHYYKGTLKKSATRIPLFLKTFVLWRPIDTKSIPRVCF